jgi:glycosyltransferase involved in cell wall biosynthesis
VTSLHTIWYLAGSTVPSATADSIHVVRMCDALRQQTDKLVLFAKKGCGLDVEEYYGLAGSLDIESIAFAGRWDLVRYCRRLAGMTAPDLAFGRYVYPLAYLARRKVPCLYEIHAPASGVKKIVEGRLLQHPSLLGVVFITNALRDYYLENYPALENRHLVLADAANDPGESPPPRASGRMVAAYVGSWFAGRGVELIAALAKRMPDIEFRLAGGGVEDLAGLGLDAPANLTCLGYVAPAAVPGVLADADVLLAPYAHAVRLAGNVGDTSAWCSPMKLFEYMAQGKAIVCADLPVFHEVLAHDGNCVLVEPENVHSWQKALRELEEDRVRAARLGIAARRQFLAAHTWSGRATRILEYANGKLDHRAP